MSTATLRRILTFALIFSLCSLLIQPAIAAFSGGELPDCHANHDEDCGYEITGECIHSCGLCDYADFVSTPAVTQSEQKTSAGSARGGRLEVLEIFLPAPGGLEAEIDAALARVDLEDVHTLVISAAGDMDADDWYAFAVKFEELNSAMQNLRNLTISGVREIPSYAFGNAMFPGCPWLESIYLPHAETIGEFAFASCEELTSVKAPNIIHILEYAFTGCPNLVEYYFGSVSPSIGPGVISGGTPTAPTVYHSGIWDDPFTFEGQAEGTICISLDEDNDDDDNDSGKDKDNGGNKDNGYDDDDDDDDNDGGGNKDSGVQEQNPAQPQPRPQPQPQPQPQRQSPKSRSSNSFRGNVAAPAIKEILPNETPLAAAPVGSGEVTQALEAALAAPRAGDRAIVRFVNKSYISLEQLREIAREAEKRGVQVQVQADTKEGNVVTNRLYINPSAATRGISLLSGENSGAVLRRFKKYTSNTLAVLSLKQEGGFGMKLGIAFKMPIPGGVNPSKLAFYSFNPQTNKYRRIYVRSAVVNQEYLWIETDYSGCIAVCDGALKKL